MTRTHRSPESTNWRCMRVFASKRTRTCIHIQTFSSNPSPCPQLPLHPRSRPKLKQQHYLIPTPEHDVRSGVEQAGGAVSAASRIIREGRRKKQKSGEKNMKLPFSPSFLHFLCCPDGLSHKLRHQLDQLHNN